MLAIWILRAAGAPVFGEPPQSEALAQLLASEADSEVTGIVADRSARESGTQYLLKDVSIRGNRPITIPKLLLNTDQTTPIAIGAVVSCAGEVRRIAPAGNPGQFDARAY